MSSPHRSGLEIRCGVCFDECPLDRHRPDAQRGRRPPPKSRSAICSRIRGRFVWRRGSRGDLHGCGFTQWYFADKKEPIGYWIEKFATLPFEARPGERFVYGYSTDILGYVIEKVSGMPLDRFLAARVFGPLMTDTQFFLPPSKASRLATVFGRASATAPLVRAPEGHRGQGVYIGGPHAAFSGGAGLLSTASDYARFLQMLLNGGELDGLRRRADDRQPTAVCRIGTRRVPPIGCRASKRHTG